MKKRSRKQLEDELFTRLGHAVEEYRAAAAEYLRVLGQFCDIRDHPDGASALHQAAHREGQAIQNYYAALKAISKGCKEK
jgi:hypothetical protein